MKTAFIVMTYNRSDALLAVLRGLAGQCQPQDIVVIADDGSNPQHVQALRDGLPAMPCQVLHVWHPDVGFTLARSRNLGATAAIDAGADYLVFMDGDCVPAPHFRQGHQALAETGCFITGSRVLLSDRFSRQVMAQQVRLDTLPLKQWLGLLRGGDVNKLAHLVRWFRIPGRYKRRFEWRGIRGCNMAMWAADYVAVDGCDETFSGWGHEDADLVLRLHNHGLVRKNGHLATEVFHLWHRENSRANESANRARVAARMESGIHRAARGLADARGDASVVVTRLRDGNGSLEKQAHE